jgi:hypothetical protein
MAALWIPLPFPKCPTCHRAWVQSYHRGCYAQGRFIVEPHLQLAACEGCRGRWALSQVTFHCSCGRVFTAGEVGAALSAASLIRDRLVRHVQSMEQAEARITAKTKASARTWLGEISYEIGRILGIAASEVKRWFGSW